MTSAFAYARDSSQMQADKGLSIPAQLKEIQKYAKGHDFEIAEEFVDDAYSGTDTDRPAFQEMLSHIRLRGCAAKAIICWKSDRFARSVEQASAFRGLLRRQNIELITVAEPMVDGPVGAIVNAILDSVNEFYSLRLGEDSLRGAKESASRGFAQGGTAPYGMKKVPVENDKGIRQMKYAPDPETAPVVQEIYDLYAQGHSMIAIARILDTNGIPTPRNGSWNSTQICNILTKHQPTYLGHLVYNRSRLPKRGGTRVKKGKEDWVVSHNAHPSIIDPDTADAVNRIRQDKPLYQNISRNARKGNPILLAGIVYCGICGNKYYSSWGGKFRNGRKRYYSCGGKKVARLKGLPIPECSNAWIRTEDMDEIVLATVRAKILTPGFGTSLEQAMGEERENASGKVETEKGIIKKELRSLSAKRTRLIDAISEGFLRATDAKDKLDALHKAIQAKERRLMELDNQAGQLPQDKELLLALEHLHKITEDPDALQALSLSLIDKIIVFPTKVEIRYKLIWETQSLQRPRRTCKAAKKR